MPHNIEQLLLNAGLLPSEVKVYLGALEMGPSSVQNIAKKTELSRTAVYEAVEMLEKRGLMSSVAVGKKNAFSAEDPERLLSYLEGEARRVEATKDDIARSLDAFRLLAGGARPTVRVYEGDEALVNFFRHVSEAKPTEYSEITNFHEIYTLLDQKVLTEARTAYPWGTIKKNRNLAQGDTRIPRPGTEYRALPATWGKFHGNIAIYGNCVSFVTFKEKLVLVIVESETLAESMGILFNIAWETSK